MRPSLAKLRKRPVPNGADLALPCSHGDEPARSEISEQEQLVRGRAREIERVPMLGGGDGPVLGIPLRDERDDLAPAPGDIHEKGHFEGADALSPLGISRDPARPIEAVHEVVYVAETNWREHAEELHEPARHLAELCEERGRILRAGGLLVDARGERVEVPEEVFWERAHLRIPHASEPVDESEVATLAPRRVAMRERDERLRPPASRIEALAFGRDLVDSPIYRLEAFECLAETRDVEAHVAKTPSAAIAALGSVPFESALRKTDSYAGQGITNFLPNAGSAARSSAGPHLSPSISTMLRDGKAEGAYARGVTLPSDILMRSADEAVRRIAIDLLGQARIAGARVIDGHATESAATELRVALRSLDVHLRVLGGRFGIHLDDEGTLPLAQGDDALDERALARASIALAERAAAPLRTISIELDAERREPTYGVALAGVLRSATARLVAALEDLDEGGAEPEADEARRAALDVCDLLAPVNRSAELMSALDVRADIARCAESATTLPLRNLAAPALREAVRARLDEAARSLESRTEREIEHKYLLRAFPPRAANADPKDLKQGYVPGKRLHERLRCVRQRGEVKYIRTIKLGSGLARMEIEEETCENVFRAMWPLTAGCRIHKERYAVKDGALTWTIDRFVDRELVLAEVEVPSSEIAPAPPDWLAEYIVKDVTGDPTYVNLNLAR